MPPEQLRLRTRQFAVAIVRFCRRLPRTDEGRILAGQLLRAGTGVGANYRAACRPRSARDFISKLGIVIEAADEAPFWLELLADAEIVAPTATRSLYQEADELLRIFVSSRETARRNLRVMRRSPAATAAIRR
jgi:four helix bundle protein